MAPQFTYALIGAALAGLMFTYVPSAPPATAAPEKCPPGLERQGRCQTPTATPTPTGGGDVPGGDATPTPTATATPTARIVPTSTPTATRSPTNTPVLADPCSASLQSRIDGTPQGGTLNLSACTYRESVTIRRPITIDGGSRAELRGSDVWADWSGSGPWVSQRTVPGMTRRQIDPQWNTPTCADGTHTTCSAPEQLWLDGAWYRRVDGSPRAGAREFGLDGSRHVVLADAPNGHTVEVATRLLWADLSNATDVTIRGFTFDQSAGSYQDAAIRTGGSKRVTFETVSMFRAGYGAINIGGSTDLHIHDAEISWNGAIGLGGNGAAGFRFDGGQVRENNRRGWDYWRGWDAAGIKLFHSSDAVLSNLLVSGNGAVGLWCDSDCAGITFRANTVRGNLSNGIEMEGSPGPFTIDGNTSSDNSGCGVTVVMNQYAGSGTGTVSNNSGSGNGGPFICKGYDGQEVQNNVIYSGNSP